jgi:hypothetical protein
MYFKKDTELEIYESEDFELEEPNVDVFKKGEKFEVDIFGVDDRKYDVQFGDGSVAFIRKDNVEIVSVNGDKYAGGGSTDKDDRPQYKKAKSWKDIENHPLVDDTLIEENDPSEGKDYWVYLKNGYCWESPNSEQHIIHEWGVKDTIREFNNSIYKCNCSECVKGKKYAQGGDVELKNVSGNAFYITDTSVENADKNFDSLSDTFFSSKDDFENNFDAIKEFSFNVSVKYQYNIIPAIYEQMAEEGVGNDEGNIQILGFEVDRYPKNDFESELPYDIEDEDEEDDDDYDDDDNDDDDYAEGGRITTNEDVLKSFLTSTKQVKANNLSTHFNQSENTLLLRNYGTIIAGRQTTDDEYATIKYCFTTKTKYSSTTTKILNKLKALAVKMGYTISNACSFGEGGNIVMPKYRVLFVDENGRELDEYFATLTQAKVRFNQYKKDKIETNIEKVIKEKNGDYNYHYIPNYKPIVRK